MANKPVDATEWIRRIRLRHLEILQTIAQQGSLTAAANALNMTQPAASQWLADIEAIVGFQLFVRGRRLKPTPYAAPLLRHVERVLGDTRRVMDEMAAVHGGDGVLVRIGIMLVAASQLIPDAVKDLRNNGSEVRLELFEDNATGLWSRFERNELDVIIGRLDERALSSGYPNERLFADQYCVVCRPDHPFARKRKPVWSDATKYPWIMPPHGTPLRVAIEATFAKEGAKTPVAWLDSVSLTTTQVLLRDTDCLAVLSRAAADYAHSLGILKAMPLVLNNDIGDVGDVGMIWKDSEPDPELESVLNAIRQANQKH